MATHSLCHIDEIEDPGAKGFRVEDQALLAVKFDGQIFVYRNWCPHLGIPLEYMPDQFLDLDKRYIQCANHGALFQIHNGHCIVGPCTGQSLKAIPHTENEGTISVTLSE